MTRLLGTRSWNDWLTAISLASICRDEGMPDERSVRRWARNHGDFADHYAAARRLGYEKRADELLEIADDSSADWIDTGNGNRVFDSVHVNRARLMIDTRKWLLSKMLPKVYGDHVTVAGDKNPDQQRAIRRIRELRRNGLSLRAIAATVAAEGVKLSLEGVKNVLAAVGDANAT